MRGLDSPKEKADHMKLSAGDSLRTPIKIMPLAEEMARSFNNYEAYRRDINPEASKANYQKFLGTLQVQKSQNYDSNINNAIEFNKRIIAFKNKEQGLRTSALERNQEHNMVKKSSLKELDLKRTIEKDSLEKPSMRHSHDPNYCVAPHQYVSQFQLIDCLDPHH